MNTWTQRAQIRRWEIRKNQEANEGDASTIVLGLAEFNFKAGTSKQGAWVIHSVKKGNGRSWTRKLVALDGTDLCQTSMSLCCAQI